MKLISGMIILALATVGCSKDHSTAPVRAEPDHVEVQHVLIGFAGSVPGKTVTRTKAEAESLATNLFARAQGGEDFDGLVQRYTDDQYPGIYRMANDGVAAATGEYPRSGIVKGFTDVSFGLAVGEVGMAAYDASTCPYGWHIIKRLE